MHANYQVQATYGNNRIGVSSKILSCLLLPGGFACFSGLPSMVFPAAAQRKRQTRNPPHNPNKVLIHTHSPSSSYCSKHGRSSRRSSWWSRREGAGPLPADCKHQSHHEEGAAKQRQDSKRREGRHPGVRVRVHWIHHQRVSAAVLLACLPIACSGSGLFGCNTGTIAAATAQQQQRNSNSTTAPQQQQQQQCNSSRN